MQADIPQCALVSSQYRIQTAEYFFFLRYFWFVKIKEIKSYHIKTLKRDHDISKYGALFKRDNIYFILFSVYVVSFQRSQAIYERKCKATVRN